jgi:uncharacterized protein (TIGR03663 family)
VSETEPEELNVVRKNFLACALLLAIAAGALGFRLWRLDARVMHGDEANQAVRTGILMETGRYEYDLKDNHGPTLYYLSLPFAWLTAGKNFAETSEITFRLVPVLFGAGLVLLLWLVRDGLGRWPMIVAALLTAISPAMTFYSRYYIQEMLLVFFTFGVIAAGWRYTRSPSVGWALLLGAFAGLTYATKETWVLSFGAAAVALAVSSAARASLLALNRRHLLAALGVAVVVAVTFYSAFFTHWRGVLDSVLCYGNYLGWAGGEKSRHIQPWHFYLQMLLWFHEGRGPVWSEALIVALAAMAMLAAWRRRKNTDPESALLWFLAVYTLALTVIYSVIRHKSPWLAISFLHGMILLAGVGATALIEAARPRWAKALLGALLIAAAWQLGGQTVRANGRFCADPRNPCVYAHTSPDLLNLVKRVEQIAAVHPAHRDMVIEVCANPYDTWPLPWYFRKFPNVGYWTRAGDVPADLRPAIIIASMDQEPAVAAKLGADWQAEFYGVRPMVLLNIRIQQKCWDKFIETRAKPRTP